MIFTFLVLTLVVHFVTFLICYASLFEEQRKAVLDWLQLPTEPLKRWHFLFRKKVAQGLECPRCVSVWVAAGVLFTNRLLVDGGADLPAPVWWWAAMSTAACIFTEYTDGIKQIAVRQMKPNE